VWLEVAVAEDGYLPDLPARINAITQGLPVEVLRVRRLRTAATAALTSPTLETLDELSPQDVFARRLAQETLPADLQQALVQRYQAVVHSITEVAA
jgi:exonuclease SbcD